LLGAGDVNLPAVFEECGDQFKQSVDVGNLDELVGHGERSNGVGAEDDELLANAHAGIGEGVKDVGGSNDQGDGIGYGQARVSWRGRA
jgi:hypothetical protein